jgi:hypothetical protein
MLCGIHISLSSLLTHTFVSKEGSSTEGVPPLASESSDDTDTGNKLFVPGYNFNQQSKVTKDGNIPMGTTVSPYFVTFGETPSGMWIKQEPEESKGIALKEQMSHQMMISDSAYH